jgi:hypothetical protein
MRGIEAVHHSEERYASLMLVSFDREQRDNIETVVDTITKEFNSKPRVCVSEVGGTVETTIEYHDDYGKESGAVFDKILKQLNVSECS